MLGDAFTPGAPMLMLSPSPYIPHAEVVSIVFFFGTTHWPTRSRDVVG